MMVLMITLWSKFASTEATRINSLTYLIDNVTTFLFLLLEESRAYSTQCRFMQQPRHRLFFITLRSCRTFMRIVTVTVSATVKALSEDNDDHNRNERKRPHAANCKSFQISQGENQKFPKKQ